MKLFREWFLENTEKASLQDVLQKMIALRDNATNDYDRGVYARAVEFVQDYMKIHPEEI